MSDATPMDNHDLRLFAAESLRIHTPANQEGNSYERCALCHYTRHPCDVYDLAAAVVRLLDSWRFRSDFDVVPRSAVPVAQQDVDERSDEDASDD